MNNQTPTAVWRAGMDKIEAAAKAVDMPLCRFACTTQTRCRQNHSRGRSRKCAMRYCPMTRINRVVTPRKQGRKPKDDVAGASQNGKDGRGNAKDQVQLSLISAKQGFQIPCSREDIPCSRRNRVFACNALES